MAFEALFSSISSGWGKLTGANQGSGPAKYDASAVPFRAAGAQQPALQRLDRSAAGDGQPVSQEQAQAFFAAVARQKPEAGETGLVRLGDVKSNPTGLTRLGDLASSPVMMNAAGSK